MQGNQGTIEQGQGRRENGVAAASVLRGAGGAGTVWASSAFDLAQGLEVTVFETRMSTEDLDELFGRS